MASELDIARWISGTGKQAIAKTAGLGDTGEVSIRYGTATTDSSAGMVTVIIDGGQASDSMTLETVTDVRSGDRVKVYVRDHYAYVAGVVAGGDRTKGDVQKAQETADSALKSVTEQYGTSSSPTTQPTTWSATAPSWVSGTYIWTRSLVTQGDGSAYTTDPVCVTGNTGTGEQGVSVASVDVEYADSTSSTTAPTSDWQTTAPAWVDGHYIWSRTTTTMSDGSSSTTASVCLTGSQGSTGAKGDPGNAGEAGEDATLLTITSTHGLVFKDNAISTDLEVVVMHGGTRITDIASLRTEYGVTAYIEWYWQRIGDSSFGVISSSDSRISEDGFKLTLSPADVDGKTSFMCKLII